MPAIENALSLEDRFTRLEGSLRRRTMLLVALGVLFPLILAFLVMRWTEAKNVGTSYLVTGPDGIIHGLARVGGTPKAVDVSFASYGPNPGEVEINASERGAASLAVRSGAGEARSSVQLTSEGRSAALAFSFEGSKDGRVILTADAKGLVAHHLDGAGKVLGSKYLFEPLATPPSPTP